MQTESVTPAKRLSSETDILAGCLDRLEALFLEIRNSGSTTMQQRGPLLTAKKQIHNAITNIRNTSFEVRAIAAPTSADVAVVAPLAATLEAMAAAGTLAR